MQKISDVDGNTDESPPKPYHTMKVTYFIIHTIAYLISLLPLWVLYRVSDGIYHLVYHIAKYRRPLVRKHLKDSFPEKNDAEITRIEKGFYSWFCDYIVETVKLFSMSERQIRRRMTFKGTEEINRCIAEGQSCGVLLGHYCNWEWITSLPLWVSPEAQCAQIYHVLENKSFDTLLLNLRQRFGAECIPMAETLRRIVHYKQENRPIVIGYISDQVPFWNNIHHWLDFLNHDTPVLTGTEKLIRASGEAAFYADVRRTRRGHYECEFIPMARHPEKTEQWQLTDTYFALLEKSIRRDPECYLWTHNRWKRTHEEFNKRYDKDTGKVFLGDLRKLDEWKTKNKK